MPVARRLPKTNVEPAPSGARDVRPYTVEDAAALLVLVETVIEKSAEESAALRNAEAQSALDVAAQRGFHASIFQKRDSIADRSRAKTDHHRVLGVIDDLVDFARLESGVHLRVGRV